MLNAHVDIPGANQALVQKICMYVTYVEKIML